MVSIFLIFGQLLVLLHFVLVPHRLCPLHGLEDVSVREAHAWADRRVVPETGARHAVASRAAGQQDAHDRCFLTCCPKESQRTAEAGRTEHFSPAVAVSPDREAAPRQAVLALAPKQGPPGRSLA